MELGGIWYISMPTSQYNEDVLSIARERGLTVIDTKHQGTNLQMRDAPVLTKKQASKK